MTDLEDLKSSDFETLQRAYQSLKDDVYRICYRFLARKFPEEIEDVASEATADIFAKVAEIKDAKGLASFTKSIAENQAVRRYVKLMAKKRGADKKESLEEAQPDEMGGHERVIQPDEPPSIFNSLHVKDIQNHCHPV